MKAEHQVEHLLLLVGGNPLPNAVSGKLLTMPKGAITLLHSADTADVAGRLRTWLTAQAFTVELRQLEESNPASIITCVRGALHDVPAASVGLNYTGGTKAMSVHAYRALERWATERQARPHFNYLDARTLQMIYDPANPESGESSQRDYLGRAISIDGKDRLPICVALEELLELHDWSLKHDPTTKPTLPKTAEALARAQVAGRDAWMAWIRTTLEPQTRRSDRPDKWKSKTQLQALTLPLSIDPALANVTAALRDELRMTGEGLSLQGADTSVFEEPQDLCEWLHGKWLEHEVLRALTKPKEPAEKDLYLHECIQNVETKEVQFDVDVVALRGYQLFGFSCSTDDKTPRLKSKLFEAYVRTRQLGGDEARTALVCCSDNPEGLQQEMRRALDTDRHIRVFGRKQLADLRTNLSNWIQSQSGEK